MVDFFRGSPIIDDDTPDGDPIINPEGVSRGLELGLRTMPFGEIFGAPPFPQELLIPRSEWQARIQEMEERKTRLSDLCDLAGLPCKDQGQTNYCWINAPVYAVEAMRVAQNQRMVILSPASVGAKIKGFRNQGGWGQEGLEYIVEHGVVPVSMWPANAIDRQYDKPEYWSVANNYRVTEWMELRPRNVDEMISCLLHRLPIAVGYNWWGHEVTAIDPVWLDGTAVIRIRNSWGMQWGDRGYGILRGNRMLADDAVVPRVLMAA